MSDQPAGDSLPTIESIGGSVDFPVMPDGKRIRLARFGPAPDAPARAGTILFLQGFNEFIEKGLETVAALQARGYGVVTFDWRGQGLSDRLLPCRRKGHIPDMSHFLNDLDELLKLTRFREFPEPHVLLGHSMGGHLALRAAHDYPDLFHRAVLTAPMADILTGKWPRMLAYGFARAAVGFGFGDAFVPGAGPYTEKLRLFEGNPLTSDPIRFARIHALIDRTPDVALGGPSFAWVYSAFRSIRMVKRKGYLEKIALPVLLLSAEEDRIVSNAGQREVATLLPDCRMVGFPGGRHELLLERDEVRDRVWEEIDRFLATP